MAEIKRSSMDLAQAKAIEVAIAEKDRLEARLEYIAMMSDIEIPEEEEAENEREVR